MIPMIRPMRAMSFCEIRLVAKARALGGVEMGSTIALDAATATLMSTVGVPPMTLSLQLISSKSRRSCFQRAWAAPWQDVRQYRSYRLRWQGWILRWKAWSQGRQRLSIFIQTLSVQRKLFQEKSKGLQESKSTFIWWKVKKRRVNKNYC